MVTPAPPRSRTGNRITALRWAHIFESLGHTSIILTQYERQSCDMLVSLHAVKTAESVRRFRQRHATRPLAVTLTGTDVFSDAKTLAAAVETMTIADRIITLQNVMADAIPKELRKKVRVVFQSAIAPMSRPKSREDVFEVCILGHLREVKDPFLAARASRLLPRESRIHITQVGGELEAGYAKQARAEVKANPRYTYLGELPRSKAIRTLARCRLLAMTSRNEGGPSAVSEALACGVPVVSTRTAGVVGLLGKSYPGLFDVGDVQACAGMLQRCETDARFLARLWSVCESKRELISPAHEENTWRQVLRELGID